MGQRIVTAIGLIAFLLVLLYFGGWVMAVATMVCTCFAVYEEYQALKTSGYHVVSWPTWTGFGIGVPLVLIFGAKVILPVLLGICLVIVICVIFRKKPDLHDILLSIMPLLTIGLPGLCIAGLALVEPKHLQIVLLALLFAVPTTCDTLAFFVGSRIGGPKLCPTVSPHKTISGAIGGMVGALLAVLVVALIANAAIKPEVLPLLPTWYEYVLIGLVGGVAGQMGDLFASLVKRQCGIKDFSNLFPGHGGMLDRLDSIFFMALAMYCFRLLTT